MWEHHDHLSLSIKLAFENIQQRGGRPFGAALVKGGQVVSTGLNEILSTHDPTTHAEIQAIREATRAQQHARLDGHVVYASGHPYPMCLAAMYLTGIAQVYYAYSNEDGEPFGLAAGSLYSELAKPLSEQAMQLEYLPVRPLDKDLYEAWRELHPTSPS